MIPSGTSGEHLFTVVLAPKVIDGYDSEPQALLVSFTTIKPEIAHDTACEVSEGEHPFIIRRSYIYYREPRLEVASKVESMVRAGVWRASSPCVTTLTARILAGFGKSKCLPRYFKTLLEGMDT